MAYTIKALACAILCLPSQAMHLGDKVQVNRRAQMRSETSPEHSEIKMGVKLLAVEIDHDSQLRAKREPKESGGPFLVTAGGVVAEALQKSGSLKTATNAFSSLALPQQSQAQWREKLPRAHWNSDIQNRFNQLAQLAKSHGYSEDGFQALVNDPAVHVDTSIHYDTAGERWSQAEFDRYAVQEYVDHNRQTVHDREVLQAKWSFSVMFGDVDVWDLIQLLHFTVDHTDSLLHYTSQFTHCLQVYNGIKEADAHWDTQKRKDLMIAALIHDIGKLLAVFGEADSNADCMNRVIPGSYKEGQHLDDIQVQWNHDQYGYEKLKQAGLPQRVLDCVHYHSLREVADHVSNGRVAQGGLVTTEDLSQFHIHLSADDAARIPFVMEFRGYDQSTKIRTDTPPPFDHKEIQSLINEYFPNGKIHF